MNLLITGGAGYIGSHFAKMAKKYNHMPIVLDNLSTGHEKFVLFGPFVKADIRETSKVIKAIKDFKIDAVVHFAAKSIVSESMENPQLYLDNNVNGTQSVLEAMNNAGVKKIIFSSSAATYGIAKTHNIKEDHSQEPINPYGKSKLESEILIKKYHENEKFKVGILRYFNVVGRDPEGQLWEDHSPETHLLPNMIQALKTKKSFKLFGVNHPTPDGTCIRDYVDVNDLALTHLEALKYLENKSILISNVGNGNGLSVKEVFVKFQKVFNEKLNLIEDKEREGDPPRLVADNSFFKSWNLIKLKNFEETLFDLKKYSI